MDDLRLALMCGSDIPLPFLQISLHQPRIKEIALIGESSFFIGVQCLNIDSKSLIDQDKTILQDTNNFQIFMTIMLEKEARDKKEATSQLLSLLFPNYQIMFTPRALIFQKDGFSTMIDTNNFEQLQEVLKQVFCVSNSNNQQMGFNPANAKAKEIADKIMRGRKRVAELNGSANASIFSQYLSILTVGLSSMSLQDLMNLTMFQLYDLVERYQLYISWDIDIRSRLAGAKPDDRPENWMKNIH